MRIAVISDLYPPHVVGGYELACADVVAQLRARGHTIQVLTSRYGIDQTRRDDDVWRALDFELELLKSPQPSLRARLRGRWFTWNNFSTTYRFIQSFQPDVVYAWNLLFAAPLAVLLGATLARRPVVAHLMDYWLTDVFNLKPAPGARHFRTVKAIFGRLLERTIRLDEVIAMSATLRDEHVRAGFAPDRFAVALHGIDVSKVSVRNTERTGDEIRLLSAGQVIPSKGIDVALAALGKLQSDRTLPPLRFDIIGTGPSEYRARLDRQVRQYGLAEIVHFAGFAEREVLLRSYADHDVFIFPTHEREPGGIVLFEAMAAGLAVITTNRGGQSEVVTPEHDGIVVPRDPDHLAAAIRRLVTDPELRRRLQRNARATAEAKLSIQRTVDDVEATLRRAAHLNT